MATIVGKSEGVPMNSAARAVDEVGGIEEEYFFEGRAERFRLAGTLSEYPSNGRWGIEPVDDQAFRTRMLVLRPRNTADFNGTVIVEWNNVSAGENFLGSRSASRLIMDGFAVVGVSAQAAGVEGDGRPMPTLKTYYPERYGSLHHPGDDFSYDIFSQAGSLLTTDRPREIDPLGGLEVRHLVAAGASQSSARLAAYINGIQPVTSVYDAFLLMVFPNAPCALNGAPAPAELKQTGGPNIFHLLRWYTYLLRDDLEVPIIVLNSEAEASECHPNSQPDTELLRWWEVAGTGHTGLVSSDDPAMAAALAAAGAITVSFAPAVRAAYHSLHHWIEGGSPPQHQPRLVKQGDPARLPRDEHGNAIGGIRWPDLEAPLGTHVAEHFGDGLNTLVGQSTPFGAEKLRALYPDHAEWFKIYEKALDTLVETGVVLPDDAAAMLSHAAASPLPGLTTSD